LSDRLGISKESICKLGLGYHPTKGRESFVFPERNTSGDICGISCRSHDGAKFMIHGSRHGFFYEINPGFKGKKSNATGRRQWTRIQSAGVECPICGKPDWCLVSSDDPGDPAAVLCSRVSEGAEREYQDCGFLHIRRPEGKISNSAETLLPASDLPVIVVEGFTDTAAAMDLGFVAVGRPSARGKLGALPDIVRSRDVIIIGENDGGVGVTSVDEVYQNLVPVCKTVIKVFPPEQFKDLRQWKKETDLDQEEFLAWVEENGAAGGNPDILPDDIAFNIAKNWLAAGRTQDGHITIRCYHGQWLQYDAGHYQDIELSDLRGQLYGFLADKRVSRVGPNGEVIVQTYKPTRSKITDIVDALGHWCNIKAEPPAWIGDNNLPDPRDLIAFQNGILDVNEYLEGNIKLYNATPALFSYNVLPYNFDENAESKIWDDFLGTTLNGSSEKIDLLAEWFGYNLLPDMQYEKLMMLVGLARAGKGTVLNAMAEMLGHHQCVSTSLQTLCSDFGYQSLIGKLAVLMGDVKVPRRTDVGLALEKILQIVGRDPVGVNRKHLNYLPQVYLSCRFTLAMNDLPSLTDYANALAARTNILHFDKSFAGKENPGIKTGICKDAADGKLVIFALEGLKRLRASGKFTYPQSSKGLMSNLKEITSPITTFIQDCCIPMPPNSNPGDYYIPLDRLYEVWAQWCEDSGRKPNNKAWFGRWVQNACPAVSIQRVSMKGRRAKVYSGMRLAEWVNQQNYGI